MSGRALLAVQELDTAADRARHRLQQLPARRELRDLEQRRRDLRARRTEVAAKRDAVVARQQQLEDNLAATARRRAH
ncbi:MAG: hypothetical protein ACYCUG_11585, partial [Acidimicrobiales bacterium]